MRASDDSAYARPMARRIQQLKRLRAMFVDHEKEWLQV